jgi:hypothetical protein
MKRLLLTVVIVVAVFAAWRSRKPRASHLVHGWGS